jgi:hypothetical protein
MLGGGGGGEILYPWEASRQVPTHELPGNIHITFILLAKTG